MQPQQGLRDEIQVYLDDLNGFMERARQAQLGMYTYYKRTDQDDQTIGSNAYGQFQSQFGDRTTALHQKVTSYFDAARNHQYSRLDASFFPGSSHSVTSIEDTVGIALRYARWFSVVSFWI